MIPEAFWTFARWHIASGDVDPAYPVLRHLTAEMGPEERLRFLVLYVAFYDLTSALDAWPTYRDNLTLPDDLARLPTGIERRGLRGGEPMQRHLAAVGDLVASNGSFAAWLTPVAGWDEARGRVMACWGNGRWASYKMAELLQKVAGLSITPTDAGHDVSTGPRQGLALLFDDAPAGNDPATLALLDERTEILRAEASRRGITDDVAEIETVLCDWHATVEGRYYVGHDLDLMLARLEGSPHRPAVLEARAASFERRWLGEHNGWASVRPALKRLYRDRGEVIWWQ